MLKSLMLNTIFTNEKKAVPEIVVLYKPKQPSSNINKKEIAWLDELDFIEKNLM